MRWQVGQVGEDRLEDFYGEIKHVLAVIFSGEHREVLLDVNWYSWVKQHPTQRLTKRVQLKYSETAVDGAPRDGWSYIDRSEPWVLASAVDHQIFLARDLIDEDYEIIFTLHTTDYRVPPNVVDDSVHHKLSIHRNFRKTL